jgi:hypothetical protein
VIEAFRENGLNTLEPTNEVSVARLETLISSLYHNLNKRLPSNQQVPVDASSSIGYCQLTQIIMQAFEYFQLKLLWQSCVLAKWLIN